MMMLAGQRQARLWDFLETGLFRELGVPTLVVSLVLFVSAMTLLGANVSELRRSYARVQQTNAALLQTEMVHSDILRVEMIVRGYALSGDPIYLTWQNMAETSLHARLASFDKLFAGDAPQRANVAKLRLLLDAHCATFDRLAKALSTDRAAAVAEIVDYGKKVKRRGIEQQIIVMRNDQMRHLAEEEHEAETRVVSAYRYAIGISSLALLLGAIGFALVIRDRRTGRR